MRALYALLLCVFACLPLDEVLAQFDPETDCFCSPRPGLLTELVPSNPSYLVDGTRFDIETFQFLRIVERDVVPVEFRIEPFFDSGMYVVTVDEVLDPGFYGANAQPASSFPDDVSVLGSSFEVRDFVDTTSPQVIDLQVTGEVLTNTCGAQALHLSVGPIGDDFVTIFRFPILVTLEAGDKVFQTLTTAFPSAVDPILVAKAPFLGRCITDEGLETLDFVKGEPVEVTMVLYDHAGNSAEPVVQTIEWPIESNVTGTGGRGGSGGEAGSAGGTGTATNGSGCACTTTSRGKPASHALWILLLAMLCAGRRRGPAA